MKGQATSTLLDENLTCEFKRKNRFTLSKSCMKTDVTKTGNGEWGMGNGEWEMGNGKLKMGNGKLKMEN